MEKEKVKRLNYKASKVVVEDDTDIRKVLFEILTNKSYLVETVENGARGRNRTSE